MMVPVSRLGVASMRTLFNVEQDGRLIGVRQPRRRTAWTLPIRLSKERPEARWRVVPCDGSLRQIARPQGVGRAMTPALRMRVESGATSVSPYISIGARVSIISYTHTHGFMPLR